MTASESMIDWELLKPTLDDLIDSALKLDQPKIRDLMMQLVPEFKPQSKISDLLYKS